MPTIAEIRRQAETEGITDQREINRRIAEAQTTGQLSTSEIISLQEEAMRLPSQERFGGYIQRLRSEGASDQEIRRLLHTPELQKAAATYLGKEQQTPKVPEYPKSYLEAAKQEGANLPIPVEELEFPGAPGAPPAQPVTRPVPQVGVPSIQKLEQAVAAVPEAYRKAESDIMAAMEKKRGAIGAWEKTEVEAAQAQSRVLANRQEEWEKLQAEQLEKEQRRQAYVGTEIAKVHDAVEKLQVSKIDPYRFYRHPDGSVNYPRSIGAAIAIGLGALGASLPARYGGTGGPNVALQIIDKAIDRDIDTQKTDILNRRAGVGLQMNLLSQMRGQFADERQAETATRIIMLETAKMKGEEMAALSKNKQVQAQAAGLLAELDQKKAVLLGDMEINAAKEHMLGEERILGAKTRQAAMRQQQMAAQQAPQTERPVPFPGARLKEGPYVPTKDDFKEAKPMVAAWKEASTQLDELIRWRAHFGQEKLNRAELAIANTKLQRLKSAMRKVDDTGARLDAGEIEMMGLDFEMGDLGYIKEKLNAVKDSVRNKVSARVEVHGFELADQPTPGAKQRR